MSLPSSRYIDLLPAVYRLDTLKGADPAFLNRFLLIFEAILGRASAVNANPDEPDLPPRKGMAELIDALPDFFYPQLEPLFPGDDEFLPPIIDPDPNATDKQKAEWSDAILGILNAYVGAADPAANPAWPAVAEHWLDSLLGWQSGWVGLNVDDSWDIDTKRAELAGALDRYRSRGTTDGLAAALAAYVPDADVAVTNTAPAVPMTLGRNTDLDSAFQTGDPVVGGVRPFAFLVTVYVSTYDISAPEVDNLLAAVAPVIDREKPAHTTCVLQAVPYTFKLGSTSILGKSTLLPDSTAIEGTPS